MLKNANSHILKTCYQLDLAASFYCLWLNHVSN